MHIEVSAVPAPYMYVHMMYTVPVTMTTLTQIITLICKTSVEPIMWTLSGPVISLMIKEVSLIQGCISGSLHRRSKFRDYLIFMQVQILYRIAWRLSFHNDYDTCDPSVPTFHQGEGTLRCAIGCSGTLGSLTFFCTDRNDVEDSLSGQNMFNYTFAPNTNNFEAV